jgi:hypothetical protein
LLAFGDNADLPYSTDFEQEEGYLPGLIENGGGWFLESGLEGEILLGGASGAQSLSLGGGQWITFDANSPAPLTVTWIDLFMKPVFVEVGELPGVINTEQSAVTGFVKIDAEGEVYAVNGDGLGGGAWVPSGQRTVLTDNVAQDWIRLTYRIDYATKTWDLFVDGQMALADLGFLDNTLNAFSRFAIRSDDEDPTAFDFFYAGEGNPLFVDSSNDGLPDAWAVSQGLNPSVNNRYGDDDMDGLDNLTEYMLSTRTDNADTDGDGVSDGMEYALGEDPLTADNYALNVLPFADGFETYDVGLPPLLNGWAVAGDTVEVQQGDVFSGQAALSVGEGASVSNRYNGSGNAVVWVDVYLKPTPSRETPEVPEDASVVYYFNEEGQPVAFDGLGSGSGFWTLLDAATSEDWRRVTVKANYQTQSYDIYVDGQRLGVGLGFAHTQPFLSRFEVRESTMVDDVSVTTTEPAGLDDDRDGLDNATEASLGTSSVVFDSDQDGLADSLEALWGLDPMVADTSVAIPTEIEPGVFYWATAFSTSEGYVNGSLSGQYDWAASGTVNVSEEEDVTLQQASMDAQSFERLFGVGENRRIWITFRAKLLVGPMPDVSELSEPAVALMGFTDRETMVVWDEASQAWGEFATVADPTDWNDYAIYLDYVNQVWSICQNGVLLASGIPFKDKNLTVFSRFKALQARLDEEPDPQHDPLQASFDDVTISNAEPTGLDYDGDGLDNDLERQLGSDILLADTDGDGLDDAWEYQYGLNLLASDANADADGDGLINKLEYEQGSDPTLADSDADGFSDGDEYYANTGITDPTSAPEAIGVGPWMIANVGNVNGAGGYTVDGRYILNAIGSGVSRDDRLAFFYQNFIGDFSVAIRVFNAEGGRVGVMARASLDDSDLMASGLAQAQGGYRFYGRSEYRASVSSPYMGGKYFPNTYLKLERNGTRFTAYRSTDGQNWAPIGDMTMEAGSEMLAGISFSSGSNTEKLRAEIEVISVIKDTDGDGIFDHDELLYGTDINSVDTDGDGVSDYDELFVVFSNPTVADFNGEQTVVAATTGSSYTNSLGAWTREGNSAYAQDQRGWLEYEMTFDQAGGYRLDITGGQHNSYSDEARFDLVIYLDGQRVDAGYILGAYGEPGTSSFYLPYLAAGTHTIRIEWQNGESGTSFQLDSLQLLELGGDDLDGNGIADWIDHRIAQTSSLDEETVYTYVSPYTLEGESAYVSSVEIVSDYTPPGSEGEEIIVEQGLAGHYYANVELAPDADTVLDVSVQNGLAAFEKTVIWEPLNLLEAEDLMIRKGDSLLLSAFTEESSGDEAVTVTISAAGSGTVVATYSLTSSDVIPYQFGDAGDFLIAATFVPAAGDPVSVSVPLKVVGLSFGTAPRVVVGNVRNWTVSGVPDEAVLEADSYISLVDSGTVSGSRRFKLSTNSQLEGTIIARLGEDGPIMGRTTVYPLVNYHYTVTYWRIVDTFEDGTQLWAATLSLGGDIPDDIEVHIRIVKAGVTFVDGSVEIVVTKDDLDDLGVFKYYMLKPIESSGSTCHSTTVYQGGERIGDTY